MRKAAILLILLVILTSSCKSIKQPDQELTNNGEKTDNDVTCTVSPTYDPVKTMLANMTLDEKIGQLFMVSLRTFNAAQSLSAVDQETESAIDKYKVGGIILFAENINNIPQTTKLIDDMQRISEIPLFVAVDEEGGIVSRITKSPEMHATVFPSNSAIGKTKNPDIAAKVASAIAREIASLGFNMNFAPVADINTNAANPVIGARAYGDNPDEVSRMVAAAVTGMQNNSVSAVVKHFPGHGDTSTDSHYGAASVSHTKERLFSTELLPFIAGIKEGVDGVMTAHILTPEIPGENVPATLKPEILTGILRKELGFEGLIITDALNMGAITRHYTAEDAAVKAILAGADILLMPQDLDAALSGIKKAYNDGLISIERIDESVERILRIKFKRGLFNDIDREDPEKVLGCSEHRELADSISKK